MNCDEAPLVFAWTPLDNGVREACIGYLMTACCVYRLMLGICVCSFVRVPEDRWPLHSHLVYMSASPAAHRFQWTWGLQKLTWKRFRCKLYRVAAVSSLYTTLDIRQAATLYIAAQYLSVGGGSIWYELCSSRVYLYYFSTININTILLTRAASTVTLPRILCI